MATNTVIVKKSSSQELIRRLKSKAVYVGLPANSDAYPDGTSVVEVGADHEFGNNQPRTYTSSRGKSVHVSGIPERSFLRSTAKENRGKWTKIISSEIGKVIKGDIDSEEALDRVGLIAEQDVKKKIVAINTPPNSPQVIAEKGSSNPLVDTGHLVRAINHVVRPS